MKPKTEPVHYATHMTHAALWTACKQGMQCGEKEGKLYWHSDVNLWGKEGTRKTKGWKLITTDQKLVTCKACLRRIAAWDR